MASFHTWLEVLSWTKALFEATVLGADLQKAYRKHLEEKDTITEAQRVSASFSTFSEDEVQAILKRLQACRDRFMTEGSGTARKRCLCSVLADVMSGNGGQLPHIDDWANIYQQLHCDRS